jgi:hypothetical protein
MNPANSRTEENDARSTAFRIARSIILNSSEPGMSGVSGANRAQRGYFVIVEYLTASAPMYAISFLYGYRPPQKTSSLEKGRWIEGPFVHPLSLTDIPLEWKKFHPFLEMGKVVEKGPKEKNTLHLQAI